MLSFMQVELDFRSGVPLYVQLVEQITHLIAVGKLQPGDRLPPVRRLAADLQVNFNTIARAYRILDDAAMISTQHGRGTFILEPSAATETSLLEKILVREEGPAQPRPSLQDLTQDFVNEARRLGYSLDDLAGFLQDYLAGCREEAQEKPDPERMLR
jgi:GntR family transcriptional regulator